MPVVFKARMDGSDSVRHHHIPLTGIYLGIAQHYSKQAAADKDPRQALRGSLISITFAAMALECFANELAEDIVADRELEDFLRGRKRFKGKGSVVSKLKLLLEVRKYPSIPPALLSALDEMFTLRNSLVHYKLTESAGRSFLPPAKPTVRPDGTIAMWSVSFIQQPTRVEPPLIGTITPTAAACCYNAAYDFISLWMRLEGSSAVLQGFERVALEETAPNP